MNLLSDDDLEKITKAKTPRKQKSVLDENGIFYIKRADGSIVTTWHHVNHPSFSQSGNDDTPNYGAV